MSLKARRDNGSSTHPQYQPAINVLQQGSHIVYVLHLRQKAGKKIQIKRVPIKPNI